MTLLSLTYVFLMKIVDNLVSTCKQISTSKGNRFLSSILAILKNILLFFVIGEVIVNGSVVSKIVMSIGAGVGTYYGFIFSDKFSKDKLYIYSVTSNDREAVKQLGDYIRSKNIKIVTFDSYNENLDKTLTAMIYCDSRNDSMILDKYIENCNDKFLKERM